MTRTESIAVVDRDELAALSRGPGPFVSVFLAPGPSAKARANLAIDRIPVGHPHSGIVMDAVQDHGVQSQAVIVDGTERVWRFRIDDPFAFDLARFGEAPSLGPLLEARQLTATHAVVTVEDDVFALTGFGAVESPRDHEPIYEALDQLAAELTRRSPELVALVGREATIVDTATQLRARLDRVTINVHPTDDIDSDLISIADQVVRDAAALAAERRTQELGQFRQARDVGQAVEGDPTLAAVESGAVSRLLVHDDLSSDADPTTTRLPDRAIQAALVRDIPITMIPGVAEGRGPAGGVGGILSPADALAVAHHPTVADGDASITV